MPGPPPGPTRPAPARTPPRAALDRRHHRRSRAAIVAAAATPGGNNPSQHLLGPPPSRLERYFAAHEFSTPHMASCSDVEPLTLGDLLSLAGPAVDSVYGPGLSLGYVPPAGSPGLRADVAAMLASDAAAAAPGWGGGGGSAGRLTTAPLSPESIFCGAPQELAAMAVTAALEAAAASFPSPARPRVVVTAPAYPGLVAVAAGHGAEVVPWAPRWGERGPAFDVADLAAALEDHGPHPPALAILNLPHSPTGVSLDARTFRAALGACAGAGVGTILVDEVYRAPGSAGLPPAVACWGTVAAAAAAADAAAGGGGATNTATTTTTSTTTLASLGGLSKWAGLPGLRAGWLAAAGPGAPRLLARLGELRDHGTVCGAAPSEALARVGVRARGLLAARAAALLAANAQSAARFFGPGGSHGAYFHWYDPPPGAAVAFPALATGESAAAWARRARDGAGVLLLPGDTFELTGAGDDVRFRLGLGRAGFSAALDALGAWLDRGEPLRV